MKIRLVNPTGFMKETKLGFSWTTLFFGVIIPAIRGDWKHFIMMFLLDWITAGIAYFVWPFIYNKMYIRKLLEMGWVPADTASADMLALKGMYFVNSTPSATASTSELNQ